MIWIGLAALVVWVGLEAKTSRVDGTLVKTHPYRRMMLFVMPTRNESVVYYDAAVDARRLLAWLPVAREQLRANITHAAVAAAGIGLEQVPRMNRFVAGNRLYQRNGRWVTFSVKRGGSKSAISVVKLQMQASESFADLCGRINQDINKERSGKKTHADKEFNFFGMFPRPGMRAAVRLARALDHYNLLPSAFVDPDALFTSVVVTNLGSLGMAAPFHHLYEWGNCPLFVMIGAVEERAVVEDGEVVVRPVLPVRFAYDERIDDGLNAREGITAMVAVLEDPEGWLKLESGP